MRFQKTVIPIRKQLASEVTVVRLSSFASALTALNAIKERKTVLVHLALESASEVERIAACLAGCACATDGQIRRLSQLTFLYVPASVHVASSRLIA